MSIRTSFRAADTSLLSEPLFGEGADALEHGPAFRRAADEFDGESGARDTLPMTGILRGSDLDVLLHGVTGSDFLYGGWAEELPIGEDGADDSTPVTDHWLVIDKQADTALVLPDVPEAVLLAKDADIAQVLPGVTGDGFLLPKDADLPLVLPGEVGDPLDVPGLDETPETLAGFPSHMLTLDPDGGFVGGTDDLGRLHDHDGWLF